MSLVMCDFNNTVIQELESAYYIYDTIIINVMTMLVHETEQMFPKANYCVQCLMRQIRNKCLFYQESNINVVSYQVLS